MARIRSIHPALFTDEAFMSLSLLARVVLPGLWTECDDQGLFAWKPLTLKARLLPADNADMGAVLAELAAGGFICAFEHGGKPFGAVRNFRKFQRPKKPSHVHHLPERLRAYVGLEISPPVPDLFPSEGEIAPQREDGEEEEGKGEEQTLSAEADGVAFEEFWKAYAPPRNARKPDARRAWAATARLRPQLADLLRAVAGYRAWLAQQSAAQKRIYPMQHPATWLRGEVWNGFLDRGCDDAEARAAWDGRAGALVDAIGAAQFTAWFSKAAFEAGPPARIAVQGTFRRKWIADHFACELARCYGECLVEVAS
jgi:hypothetical protein